MILTHYIMLLLFNVRMEGGQILQQGPRVAMMPSVYDLLEDDA